MLVASTAKKAKVGEEADDVNDDVDEEAEGQFRADFGDEVGPEGLFVVCSFFVFFKAGCLNRTCRKRILWRLSLGKTSHICSASFGLERPGSCWRSHCSKFLERTI